MIGVGADTFIALARLVVGLTLGIKHFSPMAQDGTTYLLSAGLWNVFMFSLWVCKDGLVAQVSNCY